MRSHINLRGGKNEKEGNIFSALTGIGRGLFPFQEGLPGKKWGLVCHGNVGGRRVKWLRSTFGTRGKRSYVKGGGFGEPGGRRGRNSVEKGIKKKGDMVWEGENVGGVRRIFKKGKWD